MEKSKLKQTPPLFFINRGGKPPRGDAAGYDGTGFSSTDDRTEAENDEPTEKSIPPRSSRIDPT